jgi:hypothetical protein
VAKHSAKFEPNFKHFYLKSTDVIGLCKPCFAESIMPEDLRAGFRTHEKTIEEWKQCFTSYIHEADETQDP